MKARYAAPLAMALFTGAVCAQEAPLKNIQISGWGFFRHETKKDADYQRSAKDKTDFNQTRLNVSVKGDLADNYGYVVLAPQFSKVSGQTDFVSTTNTNQQTSGQLYDPRLDLHEGYIALRPTQDEKFHILAGRQEFAYGDHLLVGSVPWHRIGRAFDGVRARYNFSERLNADVFTAKLLENNAVSSATATQDSDFHGIYLYGNQGKYLANSDLYFLRKDNSTTAFTDTSALGLRLKSKVGDSNFDYRAEGTFQQVRLAGDTDIKPAHQYDVEVGYTLPFKSTRLAVEYFDASQDYDQLFPTAHKWLGYADQFSRRNIKGYVAHLSTKPAEKLTFWADYHIFQRSNNKNPAYNFAGASLGATGSNRDIGNELDLVLGYDFTKTVQVSVGYAWVNPGKYLKDQNNANTTVTQWSFAQLLVRF